MIETRDEIPLEELDTRVMPGLYMLMRTGGYHPYAKLKVANGDEYFKEPIWPYVKKLDGYHQKLNKSGKMNVYAWNKRWGNRKKGTGYKRDRTN